MQIHSCTCVSPGQNKPFLAATVLGGCAAVVLPVEDAVVTLEAVVLAVAVVEGLDVVVVGLDVVDAGRDVEGPVAGLKEEEKHVQLTYKQ